MLDIEVVTPPSADVELGLLSVDELRGHMRVASNSDNVRADCTSTIKATFSSLGGIGGVLNTTILPTRYALYLPSFPSGDIIDLPYPPVKSGVTVTYLDGTGAQRTLASDKYIFRSRRIEADLVALNGWPSTAKHPRAVTITFDAGYDAGKLPPNLERLVKLIAAAWYENREAEFVGGSGNVAVPQKIIFGFDYLVAQLRRPLPFGED